MMSDDGDGNDGDSNEDDAVGTCYFKSTDGHCNNWSFSATRLNVHVAEAAATRGGCVVVDATRSSTKRFPDSFSKTIPVWAETISRAVARRRGIVPPTVDDDESINPESSHRSTWGSGPHLPVWVGDNERNAIASRMPHFEENLHAVLHDTDVLDALATRLAKPLRCVWVSRENEHSLPCVDNMSDLDFTPVVLVTASEPMQRHGERRTGEGGVPYAYIPGAGDDEESWAKGLTPAVFWAHKETVLGPNGSGGCAGIVDRIVKKTRGNEAAWTRGVTNDEDEGEDSAHLAPRGCLSPNERAALSRGSLPLGAGGVRRLVSNGGVSLALGSVHALALEATWDAVDAVLYVGEDLPPLPADPARWRHPESVDGDETATGIYPAPFLHAPMRYAKVARRDVADGLEACLAFIRANSARGGGTTLVACKDGVDHCVGVVVAALIDDDDDDESEHSVSKDGVRRRLADVARVHPECRPSRGTLKQVFNRMFEMRR
jgi:tRNA A64-2'-O-ribosylphosphate transferase